MWKLLWVTGRNLRLLIQSKFSLRYSHVEVNKYFVFPFSSSIVESGEFPPLMQDKHILDVRISCALLYIFSFNFFHKNILRILVLINHDSFKIEFHQPNERVKDGMVRLSNFSNYTLKDNQKNFEQKLTFLSLKRFLTGCKVYLSHQR